MARIRTDEEKEWDAAAKEIASLVVSMIPTMNEYAIRGRVYDFFKREADYSRPTYDDTYYYKTEDVVTVLEHAFDRNSGDENAMTVSSDIQWAFDQLSDVYRYRITERYLYGIIRPHGSPERRQLYAAIERLTHILNRWNRRVDYEGTGSRKVWSNARARAEIEGYFHLSGGVGDLFGEWDTNH